jgi:hypothetical protein
MRRAEVIMGEKNIKKETKKPKKSKGASSSASPAMRPVITQPEVIKKEKKIK